MKSAWGKLVSVGALLVWSGAPAWTEDASVVAQSRKLIEEQQLQHTQDDQQALDRSNELRPKARQIHAKYQLLREQLAVKYQQQIMELRRAEDAEIRAMMIGSEGASPEIRGPESGPEGATGAAVDGGSGE